MYFIENQLYVNLTNLSPLETNLFRILQHSRIVAIKINIIPGSLLDHLLSGFIIITKNHFNCAFIFACYYYKLVGSLYKRYIFLKQ